MSQQRHDVGIREGSDQSEARGGGGSGLRGGHEEPTRYLTGRVKNAPLLTMLPSEMLEMVIANLSLPDLQSLRHVNQYTKKFTTDFILKKDMCAVQFTHDPESAMFVHSQRPNTQVASLSELTSCMESSSKFPCTNFQFSGGFLSRSSDVVAFFSSQTNQIKGLSVWFTRGHNSEKTASLMNALYGLTSLETLDIGGELTSGEHSASAILAPSILLPPAAPPEGAFEKLKFLTIKSSISINANLAFISALLSAAPNLEAGEIALDPDNIKNVDVFITKKMTHLLNEMTFEPDHRAENLDFYEKFAETISTVPLQHQKLSQLVIFPNIINKFDNVGMERAAQILTKILKSSTESLKTLVLNVPTGFLRLMKNWGQLKNVNFLATYFQQFSSDLQDYLIFPMETADLNNIFPALASVSLAGVPSFVEEVVVVGANGGAGGALPLVAPVPPLDEICFPFSIGTLSKVQRLHLMLNFPISWLEIFPRVFPNVVCLLINEIQNFERTSRIIWEWNFPNLTIMELEILVSDQWYAANSFPGIDAAFTGLDKDVCISIQKTEETCAGHFMEQLENLRINSSILKLNELRDLKIAFKDQDDRPKDSYNLLNGFITGELAFRLMAGLRVSVLVTAKLPGNIQRMATSLQSMNGYGYVGALGNPSVWDD